MTVRIGVLTVSDRVSRGEMEDLGGPAITAVFNGPEFDLVHTEIVPDEQDLIAVTLIAWADEGLDVILTTGGTGLGPRDVTPDATERVADRPVPGIAEALRAQGQQHTAHAMLSRGVAAMRGDTLIINLPGSPSGAREGAEVLRPVLPHAIAILHGGRH
jgi:molybdenum cofactor synthesis domain-containing protein